MFGTKKKHSEHETIEMLLEHDGINWMVSHADIRVAAASLDELDRKLEQQLASRLSGNKKLNVLMTSNNEMIPEWMRPYMNHYFNRILEFPLRY